MELFSEIYNSYYQIMKNVLSQTGPISLDDLRTDSADIGSAESLLYIIPKINSGEWDFFTKDGNMYLSKISDNLTIPLTTLQKSYIKTILSDEKISLFLDNNQIQDILSHLEDVSPLWNSDNFYYYDRHGKGDPFSDKLYINNFRLILEALKSHQYIDITYASKTGGRLHHHYLPLRLEFSIKNNRFRLLSVEKNKNKNNLITLNLDRIKEIHLLDSFEDNVPDINALIKNTYYKEPVRMLVHTNRNSLERTMLQFANYEKNTTKIDANTYECLIYYNKAMETELLIEILSFGPTVEVVGNEDFLKQIKRRLRNQKKLKKTIIN